MDEFDMNMLRDFAAENWSAFAAFVEERGEDAQALYEKLGGEPD